MTYRNDHEAALARIDALEHELAEVRATPARAPEQLLAPRYRNRAGIVMGACTVGLFGGIVGGFVLGSGPDREPRPHAATKPAVSAPVQRDVIRRCADWIQENARIADRQPPRAETIAHVGAPCRGELHDYIRSPDLSDGEREALWQWAVQEDELVGDIARIEVYYTNDPEKLDSYASESQLWREYDRAYAGRNRALAHWVASYTR